MTLPAVDVRGIEAVKAEFSLLPKEYERAIRQATSATTRNLETAVRNEIRATLGLDVRGSKARVKRFKRGAREVVWIGFDEIPADYIPGLVTESGGQYFVGGRLVPNAFRGRRGSIRGRGRLRQRLPNGQSTLVLADFAPQFRQAYDNALRGAWNLFLENFRKASERILKSARY